MNLSNIILSDLMLLGYTLRSRNPEVIKNWILKNFNLFIEIRIGTNEYLKSGETKIIYEFIVYDLKNIYNEVNNPPYNYRIYEDYDECLIEGIKSAIDKYKSLKR